MILPLEHRGGESLRLVDLELCGWLARNGLRGLIQDVPLEYRNRTIAIYCNPGRESGASQSHLHFCMVPYDFIPSFRLGTVGCCVQNQPYPLLGAPFAGWLSLSGPGALRLIKKRCTGRLAYNLLVLPSATNSEEIRYIIVPRKAECGAGFRVGGLELMTGILIPSRDKLTGMSSTVRDQTFLETTFRQKGESERDNAVNPLSLHLRGLCNSGVQ